MDLENMNEPVKLTDIKVPLRILWLHNNRLSSLPSRISTFAASLTQLRLYNNQLEELPRSIGTMTALKVNSGGRFSLA